MMIDGIFCEWVAPYDPLAIDFASLLTAPSWDHWCGTDAFGRDICSRLIYGSRTALVIGFTSSFFGCACRKLNPAILVMQSAQDWATKNVPGAIDGARDRRIFLQG